MAWGRVDDRLAMSVKVRGLADPGATGLTAKRQRAEALGVWVQVLTWASGEGTDGFLTLDVLDLFGWPAVNARLMRARFGRAPLIHEGRAAARACPCMAGRAWVTDYDHLIHDFLDRNPSRDENRVHRAKKRELRDPALKRAVRDRDRDTCRYCGKHCSFTDRVSDDGLTFDHVDPDVAAGADNLVVACRGCNNRKNKRTPHEADMILLPVIDGVTYDRPATVTSLVASPDLSPSQVSSQVSSQVQTHRNDPTPGLGPDLSGSGRGGDVIGVIGPPALQRQHSDSPYRPRGTPRAGTPA